MHPALSIIVFTTVSGAGYGLLFWLGLLGAAGALPPERGLGVAAFALALGAVSGGLVASTWHLGHPERAWRALGQWRSSWLSREGVAALATYLPAAVFAIGWVFLGTTGGAWSAAGLLAALGALATVICTAQIYRSLKPIQRWHNGWVLPNYLALAAMTGALWLASLAALWGLAGALPAVIALATIAIAAPLKLGYWRFIDRTAGASTAGSATGLGRFGEVRLFEAPHSSDNYLLKEMGFRLARKHAARLRRLALASGFAAPFGLTLIALSLGGPAGAAAALLAAAVAQLGVFVERWLFFAEAKHTVTLYYGASRA
ncbi:MAG TPA: DmsC/YnfH family molybdoenzyme membrane anchor subunit [Stellaceae bacterium]|nr:DmsC/YnfH family molybdoenzyme membrane anchor subunit [Stellaceae bacterium]